MIIVNQSGFDMPANLGLVMYDVDLYQHREPNASREVPFIERESVLLC